MVRYEGSQQVLVSPDVTEVVLADLTAYTHYNISLIACTGKIKYYFYLRNVVTLTDLYIIFKLTNQCTRGLFEPINILQVLYWLFAVLTFV